MALWRGVGPRVCDCHPDRKHYANGLCRDCYRNTPRFKAQRHSYYQANRHEFQRRTQLSKERRTSQIRRYGITLEQFNALMSAQGGVCAICGKPPQARSLSVDHNHTTGAIRGLLCAACNRAIGMMRDSPGLLRKAADYLVIYDHHGAVQPATAAEGVARGDGGVQVGRGDLPQTLREERLRDQSLAEVRDQESGGAPQVCLHSPNLPDGEANRMGLHEVLCAQYTGRSRERIGAAN